MRVFEPHLFLSTVLTLFVILDPPGVLPVFLGLTRSMTVRERNATALRGSAVAFAIIAVFALFGRFILDYLHITIQALQVSGGLLLLLIALELLTGKGEDESVSSDNVAIVPLGIPLLGGPGSIVAMMLAVQQAQGNPWSYLAVGLALVATMLLVWVFLRFAGVIHRVIGETGAILLTRVAGMLLSAIAVQMAAGGVLAFVRQA